MAVFMEKRPRAAPTPASPPRRAPTTPPPARTPAPRARGLVQRCALRQHPHPRARQGARRRFLRALRRRPHRHRLHRSPAAHPRRHRVREGRAPCRRRNQALHALSRPDPSRFPAEMSGPLQYGPGVKAYVCTCSSRRCSHEARRPVDARPHRTAPVRSDAARRTAPVHSPSGSATPSNACWPLRPCTSMRPRCVWTGRITGSTSTAPGRLP